MSNKLWSGLFASGCLGLAVCVVRWQNTGPGTTVIDPDMALGSFQIGSNVTNPAGSGGAVAQRGRGTCRSGAFGPFTFATKLLAGQTTR